MAGESYPRTFPAEDDPGAPEVEVPSEIESPNVANSTTLEPFHYKKHGICRIRRVEDS
jgi:hypothetical protein